MALQQRINNENEFSAKKKNDTFGCGGGARLKPVTRVRRPQFSMRPPRV